MSTLLGKIQMFGERDTIEKALKYAGDILEASQGGPYAYTAVYVLYNTMAERINTLEKKLTSLEDKTCNADVA
jgi:hypothetical protein